jgi:hypothetical protein
MITTINRPVYTSDVSRFFLDTVRDRIEVVIIGDPKTKDNVLRWEVQFIDPQQLEQNYVDALLYAGERKTKDVGSSDMHLAAPISSSQKTYLALRERFLRGRFREYMQKFKLCDSKGHPLSFVARLASDGIVISDN